MAGCSYFNAEAEIQTPSKSRTIIMTRKQLAGLLEMPLGAIYHLIATKAINVAQPDGTMGLRLKVSPAELVRIMNAIRNLPARTFKGRKRKHWEALEGALKTAQVLTQA